LAASNYCFGSSDPGEQRGEEPIPVVAGISWYFTSWTYHLLDSFGDQIVDPNIIAFLNLKSTILAEVVIYAIL
jgi:hypothetical protein